MNEKQKKVLVVTGLVILAMLLYPPLHALNDTGNVFWSGYGWIFKSPAFAYGRATVNIGMLMTQWLGVVIVGGIAFFLFKDR